MMSTFNTSGAISRITKEIANIQKGSDLSLAVAFRDTDVRHIRTLIIGPPETPYEFGFFEFDVKFTKDYPIKSPHVYCITTNSGRTRFNPNIYADGKVCLSILGTWRGQRGEEWSSAQGLESVLLSIQSLMSPNPYENEPGFETAKKEEEHPLLYIAKIRHETLRIAVIQRLEGLLGIDDKAKPAHTPVRQESEKFQSKSSFAEAMPKHAAENDDGVSTPASDESAYEYDAEATFNAIDASQWDPFADLLKRRFLWYYDTYAKNIERFAKEQPNRRPFELMQFEFESNGMTGKFDYKGLKVRLERVLRALEEETESWLMSGVAQVEQGTQLATQLAFQFGQLDYKWNKSQYSCSRMEITLPDPKNPFVWHLILFGQPSMNLDGGIFNLTLSIPPTFPESQPRVKVITPIFHRQVSSTGNLCYSPSKPEEISSHLEAIVAAVEDKDPKYDPRSVVNPEAFALYWGGDDKRKVYNRKLRRSAQDSRESIRKKARDIEAAAWGEPTSAHIEDAEFRHENPPRPLDFMIFKRRNARGGWEDVVLDGKSTWKFFERKITPELDKAEKASMENEIFFREEECDDYYG